jgi:hypothetical protein
MNERIKELAAQAEEYMEIPMPDDVYHMGDDIFRRHKIFNREKFAELIVRECIELVDGLVDKQADGSWTSNELYTDYNGALHLAGRQIRQHFGVEE